ncbi:MAG TPA: TraR/DksA family transcriptional regulator [Steroidobacteraceae bacterium]|jgi:RNA polymerase-binding transcription factor DksA|nr:TraR/DksA family transcriptional regulator [Steroidobacteraceae bacterium]
MTISADFLDAMRARLLARRDELRTRLRRLGADQRRDAEPLSPDAPDSAIQRENDEVIDSLGLAADAELSEIDAALARMAAGHYGECASCGYAIERKRLEAVPYARQCLRCAAEPGARSSAA